MSNEAFACIDNEIVLNKNPTNSAPVENVALSIVTANENMSVQEPHQSTEEAISSLSNFEVSRPLSDTADSQISYTNSKSPPESMTDDFSQIEENLEMDSVFFSPESPFSDENNSTEQTPQKPTEAEMEKSQCLSVMNARPHSPRPPGTTTPDITVKPDIEDVEGMMFVSFDAKV